MHAMCPLREQLNRHAEGDTNILEKGHADLPLGDGAFVVKRYQRSAVGVDINQREHMRTPLRLARTVEHIVSNCMGTGEHGGGNPASAYDDPRIQEFLVTFREKNPFQSRLAEQEAQVRCV